MEKLYKLRNDFVWPDNLTEEQEQEEETRWDAWGEADIASDSFIQGFKKCLEIFSQVNNIEEVIEFYKREINDKNL
jgi:hypothetical protein